MVIILLPPEGEVEDSMSSCVYCINTMPDITYAPVEKEIQNI